MLIKKPKQATPTHQKTRPHFRTKKMFPSKKALNFLLIENHKTRERYKFNAIARAHKKKHGKWTLINYIDFFMVIDNSHINNNIIIISF